MHLRLPFVLFWLFPSWEKGHDDSSCLSLVCGSPCHFIYIYIRREVRTKYTQVTTTWGHPWQPDLTNITKNIYIFCLSDPKMFTAQEVQPQTTTTLGVVLLVIQLISLALLMPMALVLVSFYRRVSRQRRRDNTHSVMINVPVTNDEHSLDNQTSPLTTATFDDAGNGKDTCRV